MAYSSIMRALALAHRAAGIFLCCNIAPAALA
jgi:hypothetical protein